MKDFKIKRLSDYSEKDLKGLQLVLSVAYQAGKNAGNSAVMNEADGWGYVVREALEEKNEGYYTQFEHVTDNNPLFT